MPQPSAARVNRNDPCPCGSGKKYKKCCMGRQDAGPAAGGGPRPQQRGKVADHQAQLAQAVSFHRAGNLRAADQAFRAVVDARPKEALGWLGLGQVAYELGRRDEGLQHVRRAASLDPAQAMFCVTLADMQLKSSQPEAALKSAEQALEIDPKNVTALTLAAMCHERKNDFQGGVAFVDRAMAIDPAHPEACMTRGRLLRRCNRLAEAKELFEQLLKLDVRSEFRHRALHELGVVLDKLGEHEAAFDAFERSGQLESQGQAARRIDRSFWPKRIEGYRAHVDAATLGRWTRADFTDEHPVPAFLVGFPRSGTTMTEQILAAHPRVVTSNEGPILRFVADALEEMVPAGATLGEKLAHVTREQVARLRDTYWTQAAVNAEGADLTGRVFVDKLPLNIIDLALINVVLPEARIMVALRDPRDVCISAFFQGFRLNSAMINFLWWDRTIEFYEEVMRLWLELREITTLRFVEIRYEDTVRDLEAQARRVLDLLGVEWDESVLSFHEQAKDRFIATPSFTAVTEPVHTRAIGRWHNYADHFNAALRERLAPFVEAFGYEGFGSSC
jgi:tetratricopeptide (TPR) repeat protein